MQMKWIKQPFHDQLHKFAEYISLFSGPQLAETVVMLHLDFFFPFTSLELAICVPLGSTVKLTKTKAVNSLSALRGSSGESVFFHDEVMSQVD